MYQKLSNKTQFHSASFYKIISSIPSKIMAYMTKRDLKSLVLPLFTIVLGKNFSMTKNLLSLRLSSHH